MFEFIFVLIGALCTHLAYQYKKIDKLKAVGYLAAVVCLTLISMIPMELDKTSPTYLVPRIPECHVYVESDVDVSKWKTIGFTSTYTNIREFVFTEEEPVIIYNADALTADEARELYFAGLIIDDL